MQHFLLSKAAKTLNLAQVLRLSHSEAEAMFRKVRWPLTEGEPVCPHCGGVDPYDCRRASENPRFECKACGKDFSVTSGTLFASHKLPLRTYRFEVRTINHQEAYSLDGACTNWAEEYFSRMRRAEIGHHHHIAGAYLLRYEQEATWREDNRRESNGDQVSRLASLAMKQKPSVDFSGYWQRHIAA
jgi:transposase-like protein